MKPQPLFLLAAKFCTVAFAAPYTAEQVSAVIRRNGGPEVFIKAMAAETSRMAGQKFDDQTELIGAAALDRTMVYYVRLTGFEKADIKDVSELRRTIASRNAPLVCTAPTASVLIFEHGSEYRYIFYSKNREHLFQYSFTQATCKSDFKW